VRVGRVLVGVFVVVAACGSASDTPAYADRACELLATERTLEAPPPAIGARVSRSLGSLFQPDESGANTTVFVTPDLASELDAVAEEVGALEGIEVVEVVDQEATYEEFTEMFEDDAQLVNTVSPGILPPSVRVDAATDAGLDRLRSWAEEDERIYELVDVRETAAFTLATRAFPSQLEELEEITDGDLHDAVVAIRSDDEPTLTEVVATYDAVSTFLASC
jgi:hypothetical protein